MAVFAGEITPAQIRFHEDRNKVLRALGNDLDIKPEISMPLQLASGFHAFLLCTDGFWEYVLEEEMEIDLSKSHAPQEWISLMLQRLYKRVDGANDNFSAIAVFTDTSIQTESAER
jgi:serine/threonine protein phosphatase PrpC